MKIVRTLPLMLIVPTLTVAVSLTACEKKSDSAGKQSAGDGHDHKPGDGHDHDTPAAAKPADSHDGHDHKEGDDAHDHKDEHGHGATTQLGEQTIAGFVVKASRDGAITPGSDAAIDVWITGGTTKVASVRFWVGTQDAKGSIKAKAEIEKDNWHTHVEVPKPIPADGKLWVEIETDKGEKSVVGFELQN